MSLKTFLGKKLVKIGRSLLERKGRVSATTVYTAPITMTYHDGESMKKVGTHYLPFDEKLDIPTHRSIQPVSSLAAPYAEFASGKHYAKTPKQMYKDHCFEAWDRVLRMPKSVAIHYRRSANLFEMRICDLSKSRDSNGKKSLSKLFKSRAECEVFILTLIKLHNYECAKRQLPGIERLYQYKTNANN